MALIPTNEDPSGNMARSSRMLTEANGIIPLEDLIDSITTDPKLKTLSEIASGSKVIITDGTNDVSVNASGQMHTVLRGHVCTNCSTTTPLSAGATFTGVAEDILDYGGIAVFVTSDVASATDGLQIQYSKDGSTNWRTAETYTVLANAQKWFTPPAFGAYLRVVYTNGAADQTSFELTTVLRKTPFKWSSHNIETPITDQDDATLQKAVITGKKANGDYDNVSLTNNGNMKVSLEELESQVSVNNNTQLNVTPFDSEGRPYNVDKSTYSIQVIDYEHHEIHSGSHYNYCDYALNQASNATIEFVMTVPDSTKWPHLIFEFYASDGATLELYEGTTGVTGGTSITPRNNNRNSDKSSTVTLVKDPTSITSDGTRAAGFLAGGGRTAGFSNRDKENVLRQNTAYLVRITSLAVSNDISWCAEWYEHTDKEVLTHTESSSSSSSSSS